MAYDSETNRYLVDLRRRNEPHALWSVHQQHGSFDRRQIPVAPGYNNYYWGGMSGIWCNPATHEISRDLGSCCSENNYRPPDNPDRTLI